MQVFLAHISVLPIWLRFSTDLLVVGWSSYTVSYREQGERFHMFSIVSQHLVLILFHMENRERDSPCSLLFLSIWSSYTVSYREQGERLPKFSIISQYLVLILLFHRENRGRDFPLPIFFYLKVRMHNLSLPLFFLRRFRVLNFT